MSLTLYPVSSTNLAMLGYDPDTHTLGVRFKSGGGGTYSNVPEMLYNEILSSPSIGSAFNKLIVKRNYLFTNSPV